MIEKKRTVCEINKEAQVIRKSSSVFGVAYQVTQHNVTFWTITGGNIAENKYLKGNREISVIT